MIYENNISGARFHVTKLEHDVVERYGIGHIRELHVAHAGDFRLEDCAGILSPIYVTQAVLKTNYTQIKA